MCGDVSATGTSITTCGSSGSDVGRVTSVLFVHGTGGRTPYLAEPFRRIRRALLERRHDLRVERCLWGDHTGARLNANGNSIPTYRSARSDDADGGDVGVALWSELYQDPYYELRLLTLCPPKRRGIELGAAPPGEALRQRLTTFAASAELVALLDAAGIADIFADSAREVAGGQPFHDAMAVAGEPISPFVMATARAVVAMAMCKASQDEGTESARIATDGELRDEVVRTLDRELGDSEHVFLKLLASPLRGVTSSLVASYTRRQVTAITDATSPHVADIIRYQSRGQKMRDFIRARVRELEPPVVLLAHSLGGIMCADLLIGEAIPEVALLVTVGSQAPFFYEVDALSSLEFGQPLPAHVPRWLNIYDLRDILSYEGKRIFPGRVEDVEVNNGQPFPRSHIAYWDNPATWDAIVPRLP